MANSLTNLTVASLLDARHQVPTYKGTAKRTLDHFPGPRVGPRRGQGIEFDDLRPYFAGDDIRHIDWNVTARANQPYTRLYREEKEQTTTVIVDLRPAMFTGSEILKAVKAGELAATTLWHANHSGDRCSAIVFSRRGIRATRPQGGHRGVLSACELISDEFSQVRNPAFTGHSEPGAPGLETLLNWLQIAGRRTGVKLLFSGLDENTSDWQLPLKACAQQQALVSIMLTDKLETSLLPEGYYRYKNEHQVSAIQLNKLSASKVNTLLQTKLEDIRSVFNDCKLPLVEFNSDGSGADLLTLLARKQII